MNDNPLGKRIDVPEKYAPEILFAVPRSIGRASLPTIAFSGYDVWNTYEFSYLNTDGTPVVRRLQIEYSADSQSIVESKSLKLYLGSFSFERFECDEVVANIIRKDLATTVGARDVAVRFFTHRELSTMTTFEGTTCVDDVDAKCSEYDYNPSLLQKIPTKSCVGEFVSHLLKTNCPITGQPDWGTVLVRYDSAMGISAASLLRYIVSFRRHSGYHEQCCEQIFSDIHQLIEPDALLVACFYTRRGGIDINPVRMVGYENEDLRSVHTWRQ